MGNIFWLELLCVCGWRILLLLSAGTHMSEDVRQLICVDRLTIFLRAVNYNSIHTYVYIYVMMNETSMLHGVVVACLLEKIQLI